MNLKNVHMTASPKDSDNNLTDLRTESKQIAGENLEGREPITSGHSVSRNKVSPSIAENGNQANFENKDFRHKIWQLVTFFRRVFIYFVVVALAEIKQLVVPLWGVLIFKCLPVFTLCVFVYRQFNSLLLLQRNRYALLVFIGMTFSFVGDGLLVYQENHVGFFLAGLISFAIAHVLYTFAFGWRPLKSRMMARSLIAAGLVYYYLYSGKLKNDGYGLIIGVAAYIVIIMTMQWRAWARLSYQDIKQGRYYEILGALGASFFALSDAILGINKFRFSVFGSDYSILATYYLGQMLIALSVIDGPNICWPQESAEESDGVELNVSTPTECFTLSAKKLLDWLIS